MIINEHQLDNVRFLTQADVDFDAICEKTYISNIVSELRTIMKEAFLEFNFVIYSRPVGFEENNGASLTKRDIVFYLSDETSSVPTEVASKTFAVFKNYLMADSFSMNRNIFSLPLGYFKTTLQNQVTPIEDRKSNLFFSGQLNRNRGGIYNGVFCRGINIPYSLLYLLKLYLPKNFDHFYKNSYIRFTESFGQGVAPEQYSALLYDTKIALCPNGQISPETFRHYEAMRAGCIILSSKLPDTYFYRDSPIIQLEDWKHLRDVGNNIINDATLMKRYHQDTLAWWQDKCSEKAVASYIFENIKKLKIENINRSI